MNRILCSLKKEWVLILMSFCILGTAIYGFSLKHDRHSTDSTSQSAVEPAASTPADDIFSHDSRLKRSSLIQERAKDALKSGQISLTLQLAASIAFMLFVGGCLYWLSELITRFKSTGRPPKTTNTLPVLPITFSDFAAVLISIIFFDLVVTTASPLLTTIFKKILPTSDKSAVLFLLTLLRSILVFIYIRQRVLTRRGLSLSMLGLHFKHWSSNAKKGFLAYGAVLPVYVASAAAVSAVFALTGQTVAVQTPIEAIYAEEHQAVLILSVIFVGVVGPFFEEFVFRGVVYNSLKSVPIRYFATISSSFVFAAFHAHLAAFLPIIVLSLALNYIYDKTGSLIACGTLHASHNAMMLLFVFGMKGLF